METIMATPNVLTEPFTADYHDAIMFGDRPCPWCNDTRLIGNAAYPSACKCQSIRWKKRMVEQILPLRYHRSNLWTLKPSTASKMSQETQQKMIDYFLAHPDDSYFLYGAPGTSKTTFATALIRRALERDWKEWFWKGYPLTYRTSLWIRYVNWDSLIQEYLDYQNDKDAPPPSVTPRLIREARTSGKRPVLCIEELDKSRLTEFKANKFFEFMVAMDETQGQIILTTNHRTQEHFERWLYKTDIDAVNMAGEPAWRRIMDNCKTIEFKASL
jgi:DNA replication protein DnaC